MRSSRRSRSSSPPTRGRARCCCRVTPGWGRRPCGGRASSRPTPKATPFSPPGRSKPRRSSPTPASATCSPPGTTRSTELPAPQAHALRAALLLEEPSSGSVDERAVSLGFLGVLRALARSRPVLVGDRRRAVARPSIGSRAALRSAPAAGARDLLARAALRGARRADVLPGAGLSRVRRAPGGSARRWRTCTCSSRSASESRCRARFCSPFTTRREGIPTSPSSSPARGQKGARDCHRPCESWSAPASPRCPT